MGGVIYMKESVVLKREKESCKKEQLNGVNVMAYLK